MDGMVTGGVRLLLRLEGAALLAVATAAYFWFGGPWWLFLVLFFAPDLSFIGYLGGPRNGAIAYNIAHATPAPLLLLAAAWVSESPTWLVVAFIWLAHVGFDRALGYGLKYGGGFGLTHLGRIGRGDRPEA